jgi:hypothetical protein
MEAIKGRLDRECAVGPTIFFLFEYILNRRFENRDENHMKNTHKNNLD